MKNRKGFAELLLLALVGVIIFKMFIAYKAFNLIEESAKQHIKEKAEEKDKEIEELKKKLEELENERPN